MPPPYSLAGSHQKSPPPPRSIPSRGVRLTLYRAKERGRQVLPPSFASATLEIYYADSGGAVGRSSGEERRAVCKREGGCGNLKLYLPYATNDFSPPFVSLPPSFSLSIYPLDVCADLHSLLGAHVFIRRVWDSRDVKNVGGRW